MMMKKRSHPRGRMALAAISLTVLTLTASIVLPVSPQAVSYAAESAAVGSAGGATGGSAGGAGAETAGGSPAAAAGSEAETTAGSTAGTTDGITAGTPAIPKLETIRVALLLNNGRMTSNEAQVTLSSDKGLALRLGGAGGVHPLPAALTGTTITAALDQYGVLLTETGDFGQAKTLAGLLQEQGRTVQVLPRSRQGKTYYQVAVGPFPSREAASSAMAALTVQPAIAVMAKQPLLTGPLHLQAGAFPTEAEALQLQGSLSQAGYDSDITYIEQKPGVWSYAVWLGSESEAEKLNALKLQVLLKQPGLALAAADTGKPYLIRRGDLSMSSSGANPALSLLLPMKDVKLQISPKEGRITLAEKSGRSYRGAMEVQGYNGRPALINELPFEQYLYSVVQEEMGKGWPMEALKAQAVAARTFALKAGWKYGIAHVSDTSLDQVYRGAEAPDVTQAVDATVGEVLIDNTGLITAFFSSNAGGLTSSGEDVWGGSQPYLKVVASPDERAAQQAAVWRHIVLADGTTGYVHGDYLKAAGQQNPAGLPYYTATGDSINVRQEPFVDNAKNPPVAKLNRGDRVIAFGEAQESNAYSWSRGPYSPSELLSMMNKVLRQPISGVLQSLTVMKKGTSGRVMEVSANGRKLDVSSPDAYRSVFGGLPSTRFEIEQSGRYTIEGAGGTKDVVSGTGGLAVLSGSGQVEQVQGGATFILNGDGNVRQLEAESGYTFIGTGNGHGAGMSQWGARSLAEQGYDYRKILLYYYEGVTIAKE